MSGALTSGGSTVESAARGLATKRARGEQYLRNTALKGAATKRANRATAIETHLTEHGTEAAATEEGNSEAGEDHGEDVMIDGEDSMGDLEALGRNIMNSAGDVEMTENAEGIGEGVESSDEEDPLGDLEALAREVDNSIGDVEMTNHAEELEEHEQVESLAALLRRLAHEQE